MRTIIKIHNTIYLFLLPYLRLPLENQNFKTKLNCRIGLQFKMNMDIHRVVAKLSTLLQTPSPFILGFPYLNLVREISTNEYGNFT